MEIEKKHLNITNFSAFVLFVFIAILLLRSIIFSPGLIIGEDLAPPLTLIQIKSVFDKGRFAWDFNNFIPFRNFSVGSALLYQGAEYIVSLLGVNGDIFIRFFIVFVFAFAGFAMYVLLKFLRIQEYIAMFSGVFYITTPLFFNYAIMGWLFVLLVMGTLPFTVMFFIKAVNEDKLYYAVVAGIIYAISFIQSQSLVWFPIVFLSLACYLINDKNSCFVYFKTLFIMSVLFVLLNAHVILHLLILPDKVVSGSEYIMAPASLGMMAHFYPLNILRLWGALFNYQYETIINKLNLSFLSFVPPVVAACALFLKKERKLVISFWIIALVPLLMYYLNFHRSFLLHIPFSNLIRDFPRFTILSTFSYTVLIAIFLNNLIFAKEK